RVGADPEGAGRGGHAPSLVRRAAAPGTGRGDGAGATGDAKGRPADDARRPGAPGVRGVRDASVRGVVRRLDLLRGAAPVVDRVAVRARPLADLRRARRAGRAAAAPGGARRARAGGDLAGVADPG